MGDGSHAASRYATSSGAQMLKDLSFFCSCPIVTLQVFQLARKSPLYSLLSTQYIYIYIYTCIHIYIYISIYIYIYVCQFLSWWLPSPLQKNNGPTAHLVGRTSPTALGIGDAQFGEFQCDHQCLRERLAMGESNLHLRKARVIWQNLLFFHVLLRKYV